MQDRQTGRRRHKTGRGFTHTHTYIQTQRREIVRINKWTEIGEKRGRRNDADYMVSRIERSHIRQAKQNNDTHIECHTLAGQAGLLQIHTSLSG